MNKLNNFDFLICIAKGVNPITGEVFPESDILHNPEISARLFKLAYDLQNEEKEITEKIKKEFKYTEDINNYIVICDTAYIGNLASTISRAIEQKTQYKIFSNVAIQNKINTFLTRQGILEPITTSKNGRKFTATEYGKENGFSVILEPERSENDRIKVVCSEQAQNYILSKLPEILNS